MEEFALLGGFEKVGSGRIGLALSLKMKMKKGCIIMPLISLDQLTAEKEFSCYD